MTNNPYGHHDVLYTDFSRVDKAQNNQVRQQAVALLLARSGCLNDALAYYEGADPVHEIDNEHFASITVEDSIEEMMDRSVIGMHAAEVLISSVAYPGLYDRRDSRRVRLLSKEADWYRVLSKKRKVTVSKPYDNIGEALDIINENNIDIDGLAMVSKGAEMLSSSLTWWQIIQSKYYEADRDTYIDFHDYFRSVEMAMFCSTLAVQDIVGKKALYDGFENESPEDKLNLAKLGIRSQWRSGAVLTHPLFRYSDRKISIDAAKSMVETLRHVFLSNDLIDTSIYPKNEIKGLLHESLWLLDGAMIMLSRPEDYKTICLSISSRRFDEPIINYPELNRGVDYAIKDVDNDDLPQLINLKSGLYNSQNYHPRIKVVNESRGLPLQRKHLLVKLDQYQKLLDSDFSNLNSVDMVKKYSLPSIQDELAIFEKLDNGSSWPYI